VRSVFVAVAVVNLAVGPFFLATEGLLLFYYCTVAAGPIMRTQTRYDEQCRPVTKQYIPVLHSQTVMPNNADPLQTVPAMNSAPVNTRFEQ
jgi:hypothetical protein